MRKIILSVFVCLIAISIVSANGFVCYDDPECGTNYYKNELYCSYGNVYDTYVSYICNNPGTMYSSCSSEETPVLKEVCYYGCSDGKCEEKKESDTLGRNIYIKDISFSTLDRFFIDEELAFSITLVNDGDFSLEDVKVSVVIYELGLYIPAGKFDLDDGDQVTKNRNFYFYNNIRKGKYDARIVISNDDIRRVVHREVTIV
jgi:hypothetical protein